MYYLNWINNCKMINSAKSYKSFILKNDNENIIKQYSIKQCSCDRAYQFSFLYDLLYPNYLEKPTSDGEYIKTNIINFL